MAGGTHVFDMIKRLKENANLRNKRSFFKAKHTYAAHVKPFEVGTNIETEEHHVQIMKMVQEERRREKMRSVVALIVSILVIVTAVVVLWFLKPS